jgi:hypothetical protein
VTLTSREIKLQRFPGPTGNDGGSGALELLTAPISFRANKGKASEVEVRIDRSARMIYLYVDGTKIGEGFDPLQAPEGRCAAFESLSHSTGDLRVSDLTVEEWDTQTQRLRVEPRAGDDLDTLTIRDGDRFSGRMTGFDPSEGNEQFFLKTDLSPEPLTIPLKHSAVLYFARDPETESAIGRYQLNLRVGGSLTLSEIQLNPDTLTASHPWLGKLQIDRRVMQSITKSK